MAAIHISLRRLACIKKKHSSADYTFCIESTRRLCVLVPVNLSVETGGSPKDLQRKGEIAEDLQRKVEIPEDLQRQAEIAKDLQRKGEIVASIQGSDKLLRCKGEIPSSQRCPLASNIMAASDQSFDKLLESSDVNGLDINQPSEEVLKAEIASRDSDEHRERNGIIQAKALLYHDSEEWHHEGNGGIRAETRSLLCPDSGENQEGNDDGIRAETASLLCHDSDKHEEKNDLTASSHHRAAAKDDDDLLRESVSEGAEFITNSPPHSLVYSKEIYSLCKAGEVDKAHKLLYKAMIEGDSSLKPHYFNDVIVAYAKANRCVEALEVCDSMSKHHGFRPHQTAYHSIMSSYLRQAKVIEALDMFDRMRRDGWQPNEVTASIVAYGLCKAGHTEEVKALFRERLDRSGKGLVNTSVCNALLESFYRRGELELASELEKRIFSGLCFPNAFTFATMIRGRCRQGKADEARELFVEMEKRGCRPILACYGSIISLLCKQNKLKDAYDLFGEMRREGIEGKGAFCIVLLKRLSSNSALVDEALDVCKYATDRRMLVDDATFIQLLEALSKAGRLGEAKPFLDSLMGRGCISSIRRFRQALQMLQRREKLIDASSQDSS